MTKKTDQELWDEILIKGWDKDINMWQVTEQMRLNGIAIGNIESMSHLLRAPHTTSKHITNMTVRQFISAEMNWLSNYLWNTYEDHVIEKNERNPFIKKLTASEYTVGDYDHTNRTKWNQQKRKDKIEHMRNKIITDKFHASKDNYNDNWGTTKPVRSGKIGRKHK